MSSHEKAVSALNQRLERLQANLREAESENTQRFLLQSIAVTIGLGEALNDYIKKVGEYAQRRHAELKQANEAIAAQHAEVLNAGKELLERFKANPTDRALRKELELAQKNMTALQKTARRGTNALQREVAPSIAMIDTFAESVRRFSEADRTEALKRQLRTLIEHVRELFRAQSVLPAKAAIDYKEWEDTAFAEIDQANGLHDAYARAGFHALRALDLVIVALSENPPTTAEDANHRANESVLARIKAITARFIGPA